MSINQQIVALVGKAGSGKSTAAEYLMAEGGFRRVKFADPLKDMLRAIGLGEEEIEGSLKNEPCAILNGQSPRYAMITLGTEWGRNLIGPDFWTNLWVRRATSKRLVVVDDCRFLNEAAIVRQNGGIIIRIIRPDASGGTNYGTHVSETEQDQIKADFEVENTGTIDDLGRAVLQRSFNKIIRS